MNLEPYLNTDLGINSKILYDLIRNQSQSIFVDLGVRSGISSEIMLFNSVQNENRVYGVDVDFSKLNSGVSKHQKYIKIQGDSSTVGKYWSEKINLLFIDTFHIKEQVLSELYFWYPHIEENGFIVFHDTNWPKDKFDIYGGIKWDRVEDAVKEFFKTEELDFEDDHIEMKNYPDSWGMTVVKIKKKKNYILEYQNWEEVFEKRNLLINLFWNENNKQNIEIDLLIHV